MEKLKIYFLGSGDIGVPVLRALAGSGAITLAGVGSQPDRPGKRGGRLLPTPVTEEASRLGMETDRPASVNDAAFLAHLLELAPDMVLVVSYGQLLKKEILSLPEFGCINIHGSLLPKYRGASPIQQVILARERETGVCFMEMEEGLDTGAVYARRVLPLNGTERADTLELALGKLAADSAAEILQGIADGTLQKIPQDSAEATLCRKIRKEQGMMDFRKSAGELEAMVRAFYPWPGASFLLALPDKTVRVTVCGAEIVPVEGVPGSILERTPRRWVIACGTGALALKSVSIPGKRVMPATGFLNGLRGAPMEIIMDGQA